MLEVKVTCAIRPFLLVHSPVNLISSVAHFAIDAIVLAPAVGACTGASGTLTSSNSSWETALIVQESNYALEIVPPDLHYHLQTPIQNANNPRPVKEFLMRYGLRARINAADCL